MPYAHPESLVSTEWLAGHLEDPSIRVIEVDEDTEAYRMGHIPGAIAWNWATDLHHPVRRDYLDQDAFNELLSLAGVDTDTTVVLYGGNNNWFAAYAFWLLKYRGFDAVKLLNGGRRKWEAEKRPLSREMTPLRPTSFRIRGKERPELRAMRDQVLKSVAKGRGKTAFVDVRSPQEFSGETLAPPTLPQEQPYVGGHIPGAANIPWSQAAADDGTFRTVEELTKLYAPKGVTPDREVVAYCRIGERSSHTWFVLTQLLGYQNVRNYDGSWTEYGSLVGAPVERGM